MLDQASETQHTHQCSHCGALYDVVSINKRWLGKHDERVVCERLTQQDIAERVGSSREMVSRIFKDLTKGGYVAVASGRIRILKRPPAAW